MTDGVSVQMRAEICPEWSWASAVARIPQIYDLILDSAEGLTECRITVLVADADLEFARQVVFTGPLTPGRTSFGRVHVPLSPRRMSQVTDRQTALCSIVVEDATSARVVARFDEAIDLQPRDLWLRAGDPILTPVQRQFNELHKAHQKAEPDSPEAEAIAAQLRELEPDVYRARQLSRSLLSSFVRPNHPDVAAIAREAAELLGRETGDDALSAYQRPPAEAAIRADATVNAIYRALMARNIAYSEPPPGWDYRSEGQRIRDHGDVARGGLGTCLDTTVLMAAVLEQAGLFPVMMMVKGHIFLGYWRRNPRLDDGSLAEWYPSQPYVADSRIAAALVAGEFLGIIETTAFASTQALQPADARLAATQALEGAMADGDDWLHLVYVLAAREAGVSPLPAVGVREDGAVEVVEYHAGGAPTVMEIPKEEVAAAQHRQVDDHPARYRTWKSSLFTLNANNALLNLGNSARVQPVVLPPEQLGILEDRLHEDHSFHVRSGFDVSDVWVARGIDNATALLESDSLQEQQELTQKFLDKTLFVQRIGRSRGQTVRINAATCVRELKSMAHTAKVAREERGMNPLFLCIGLLRWSYQSSGEEKFAEAPLILVPVNISVGRRDNITLSLDATQQTTTNAALIEWLRREHGITIPGLDEPLVDRAGIDVAALLEEVDRAIAAAGIRAQVKAEAKLAVLDLSAFRMWQDMNLHAERFLEQPLIKHLVETPTEQFLDPVLLADGSSDPEAAAPVGTDAITEDELEALETPLPADSTQKRAVLWARSGRTFVLQGPPGTGKSQTISNIVAECLLNGMRVLFVAEKGTALRVVQDRLNAIGLKPFALNLHHEGSTASAVRSQLAAALNASVTPDPAAMENARRRLRSARFELGKYPQMLHKTNASGLSAYSARDRLLILEDGQSVDITETVVAHQPELVDSLRDMLENLQAWTSAASVRPGHPWRLAGGGNGDPFDVAVVSEAIDGVIAGTQWASTTGGALRQALDTATRPRWLSAMVDASQPGLPVGATLAEILDPAWPTKAITTIEQCARSVNAWAPHLRGYPPGVLDEDLTQIASSLRAANESGFLGRSKRQGAALAPLTRWSPAHEPLQPVTAGPIIDGLVKVQNAARGILASLQTVPGFGDIPPANPFLPDALAPYSARLEELTRLTAPLRGEGQWLQSVRYLAITDELRKNREQIAVYVEAWRVLWDCLAIQDDDFDAWLGDQTLVDATLARAEEWSRQRQFDRLLPLQHWCALVRKLEPLRQMGLNSTRVDLLEGRLSADVAADALDRGVAKASLAERIATEGLDRFSAVTHDQRVTSYSGAQADLREQWVTDAPSRLLRQRKAGQDTGGLARELNKTTRKLGTRAILRKHGAEVQKLTPLILCSPSSVVDLIEPGVMEFDLVIFDEASQITVPEAIGALGRARAAVIVGDSKQMPPTRRVGRGAPDEEIDDPLADEIVEDQESILSECEIARVPALSLNWHYRSQDEVLIAFSNQEYYQGELSSFPTPTLLSSETGLEFHRVHWPENNDIGMYLRAGAKSEELDGGVKAGPNTNRFEAMAIYKYVLELLDNSDTLPSLGIVTFNEPQRQLIEEVFRASTDPRIQQLIQDDSSSGDDKGSVRRDPLFFKALEQVQGDERDTIIFSVAFSKQASGRIPTNFGPLSNSGGERRLNVAITRARRKNVIFCSFDPGELAVEGSAYKGPKDLKAFLLFAAASGAIATDPEAAQQRQAIRDRHRDEIAEVLRSQGLHVMADVGMSDFRLDLVLSRPGQPDIPLLPVLLDGESWQKRTTVSDRDVLPVEVLTNFMGWPRVARIWWPMWIQNREQALESIRSEVELAESLLIAREAAAAVPALAEEEAVAAESMLAARDAQLAESASRADQEVVAGVSASIFTAGRDFDLDLAEEPDASSVQAEVEQADYVQAEDAVAEYLETSGAFDTKADASETFETFDAFDAEVQGNTASDESRFLPAEPLAHAAERVSVFTPASTAVVGATEMLDRLSEPEAARFVAAQLEDVINHEGPIEVGRLARVVGRRFGLGRVRAGRSAEILRLIPPDLRITRDELGEFVWPPAIDPDTWTGYRTVDRDATRKLDEVAPQEIGNAMTDVLIQHPDFTSDTVIRITADTFGISRLGANVRARLEAVEAMVRSRASDRADDTDIADVSAETNTTRASSDEATRDLAKVLAAAIALEDAGALDAGVGYVQWKGHPQYGLYLEVGDGQVYEQPFDPLLAEALQEHGWNAPRDGIRNCWFELPLAPGESESSFATRVDTVAGMVLAATHVLSGGDWKEGTI